MPGPSQISCPVFPCGVFGKFFLAFLARLLVFIYSSLVQIVVIFNCSSINHIDGVVRSPQSNILHD